jgi:hypothetical protein
MRKIILDLDTTTDYPRRLSRSRSRVFVCRDPAGGSFVPEPVVSKPTKEELRQKLQTLQARRKLTILKHR